MPTTSIPIGMPVTMVTNQVYALPAVKTTAFSSDTTPTLEQSNDSTFAAKAAVTFTGGSATMTGLFVRATAGTPTIVLKRD
jgi:predicted RecA/RadA family phage recombinase